MLKAVIGRYLIVRKIQLIFLVLCFIVFFAGCATNPRKNASSENSVQNASVNNTAPDVKPDIEPDIESDEPDVDINFKTGDCMLDDKGNILIMREDGYELYTYDKYPELPGKVA